jgi:hypothetical protein
LAIKIQENSAGIVICLDAQSAGLVLSSPDDRFFSAFCCADDGFLRDDLLSIRLGSTHDSSGFLLCFSKDPISVVMYLLSFPNLAWDGCPHLIDDIYQFLLVEDHQIAEGHPPALHQQLFQSIDKKEDIYDVLLLSSGPDVLRVLGKPSIT